MVSKLKNQLLEQLKERGLDKKHIPIICEYLDAIELRSKKELLDEKIREFENELFCGEINEQLYYSNQIKFLKEMKATIK